jgi:glycosyltransferase involved in cell wall biosynthesis
MGRSFLFKKLKEVANMKILFGYEAAADDKPEHSSGPFDGALYEILLQLGNVTVSDGSEQERSKLKGRDYDWFVGTAGCFAALNGICRFAKSLLLTEGRHPAETLQSMLTLKAGHGLPDEAFQPSDIGDADMLNRSMKDADYMIGAGNMETYSSYIRHGVPKRKLKTLLDGRSHRPAPQDVQSRWRKDAGHTRIFTFMASEIGFSSGFDAVFLLFSEPIIANENIQLHIAGKPANAFFAGRIAQLQSTMGGKLFFHGGQLDAAQRAELLARSDFILYPTLGKHEPLLLEAISHGVIPMLSRHAGIDFSPLGLFDPVDHSQQKQLLLQTQQLSDSDILALKRKTLDYFEEYHLSYQLGLESTLTDVMNGSLYPKISIILPVFNKEATIVSLLSELHLAINEYGNAELRILFDGCSDRSEQEVRGYFGSIKPDYSIAYETTPNLFETRSNNIGLKKATGAYCVIVQDDNYVHDRDLFFEAVQFMEKNRKCAILGCLSGVNFYPRGTVLQGPGQISCTPNEVYWRQDERADPQLASRVFEVDACMRGPLILRKTFLERYGYLDEVYAPLYQDDMDLCFRARHYGYKTYAMLADVENRSLTMANYNSDMSRMFQHVMERNTNIFYGRWTPSTAKDYAWVHRTGRSRS